MHPELHLKILRHMVKELAQLGLLFSSRSKKLPIFAISKRNLKKLQFFGCNSKMVGPIELIPSQYVLEFSDATLDAYQPP